MSTEKIIGAGQDKALFLEFIEFCDKQPKDKMIIHHTWQSCAVGDFVDYLGLDDINYQDFKVKLLGKDNEVGHTGNDELPNLQTCLSVGDNLTPTLYGKFTEFLKSYLPTISETV